MEINGSGLDPLFIDSDTCESQILHDDDFSTNPQNEQEI